MKNIATALVKAQLEFPVIMKDSNNPFFKSKYAGLDSILPVVLPILNKHELVLVQSPFTNGDRIGVETTIYHSSGEFITSKYDMQLVKNDPQGAGSAITYARRYALVSVLGLNCDVDDDAEKAMPRLGVVGGQLGALPNSSIPMPLNTGTATPKFEIKTTVKK